MAAPPTPERFTLYITNRNYSSWSLRTWLLMKHAAIPFAEQLVPITETPTQAHFLAFSPTGRVPCLHDAAPGGAGEREPVVVCESLAIAEYLAEGAGAPGRVWPRDARARAWARVASCEMATGFAVIRDLLSFNVGVRVRLGEGEREGVLKRDLDRLDAVWSEGLKKFGGPWLAGSEFGAVDSMYAPLAFRLQTFGIELSPEAMGYCKRLLEMEEMKEWAEKSIKEAWREAAHERDSIRGRKVLEDKRATE